MISAETSAGGPGRASTPDINLVMNVIDALQGFLAAASRLRAVIWHVLSRGLNIAGDVSPPKK
jgi:hypothetical protein